MDDKLVWLSDVTAALNSEGYTKNMRVHKKVLSIPAVDAVEVVRCGKCKYGKYTGTEWFCDLHSGHEDKFGEDASYHEYHSKHWFCADGQRREDGDA